MMKVLGLFAAAMLLPSMGWATSTLSQIDYRNAGDGLAILDGTTKLEWLRTSRTLFQTVTASLGTNPGYHLATPTEVQQLFTDAGGFTAFDGTPRTGQDETTAKNLMDLFGPTFTFDFGGGFVDSRIRGHVLHPGTSTYDMYEIGLRPSSAFFSGAGGSVQFIGLGNVFGTASSIEANFMVSNAPVSPAVPEPGTYALLGGGLLALARWRTRKG